MKARKSQWFREQLLCSRRQQHPPRWFSALPRALSLLPSSENNSSLEVFLSSVKDLAQYGVIREIQPKFTMISHLGKDYQRTFFLLLVFFFCHGKCKVSRHLFLTFCPFLVQKAMKREKLLGFISLNLNGDFVKPLRGQLFSFYALFQLEESGKCIFYQLNFLRKEERERLHLKIQLPPNQVNSHSLLWVTLTFVNFWTWGHI